VKDVTKKAVERLVDQLAAGDQQGDYDTAYEMVRNAGLDVTYALASAALVGAARARRRAITLEEERKASRNEAAQHSETATPFSPSEGGFTVYSRRYWEWVESTDQGKRWHDARERWEQSRWSGLRELVDDMTAQLRIKWEKELLDSKFALSDGTRVSWADATIEQHEERAAMFERNVLANAEGAARHRRAIADLTHAGVGTLGELTAQDA
jgi:hypothetical protein